MGNYFQRLLKADIFSHTEITLFDYAALDQQRQKETQRKGGGSGFLAPFPLSDSLVKFFGTGEDSLSRADVVKRMWNYIKQNDLQ
ncbi:unnamed protein product, partial [Ilex paraguariensis]